MTHWLEKKAYRVLCTTLNFSISFLDDTRKKQPALRGAMSRNQPTDEDMLNIVGCVAQATITAGFPQAFASDFDLISL